MDDWILGTLDIPSVTAELGFVDSYIDQWTIKSRSEALKLCQDNSQWLEHVFAKLGGQVALNPIYVKKTNQKDQVEIYMNATNEGLSEVEGYEIQVKPDFGTVGNQPTNSSAGSSLV